MQPTPAAKQPDYLRILLYILIISVLLRLGQPLLVPLSFALLISFVLYPICRWLEQHKVPRSLAIALALLLLLVALGGLVFLLIQQFVDFSKEWPSLQAKVVGLVEQISSYLVSNFNLPVTTQGLWLERMLMSSAQQVLPVVRQLAYNSAVGFVLLVLIPFYSALILFYREQYVAILPRLFPQAEAAKIQFILRQTITTFYNFIKGIILVYFIVGMLNVIGLLMLGIPHAFLFGIIASLLTIIPYVGITLGSLLPITIAWLTYDSVWYPLGVIALFTVVQYLEANVIFPVAVSYRLQVNTLFMILAIIAGGLIWGAAGMILFVPFLAIAKLVADHVAAWQTIGHLIGIGTQTTTDSAPRSD